MNFNPSNNSFSLLFRTKQNRDWLKSFIKPKEAIEEDRTKGWRRYKPNIVVEDNKSFVSTYEIVKKTEEQETFVSSYEVIREAKSVKVKKTKQIDVGSISTNINGRCWIRLFTKRTRRSALKYSMKIGKCTLNLSGKDLTEIIEGNHGTLSKREDLVWSNSNLHSKFSHVSVSKVGFASSAASILMMMKNNSKYRLGSHSGKGKYHHSKIDDRLREIAEKSSKIGGSNLRNEYIIKDDIDIRSFEIPENKDMKPRSFCLGNVLKIDRGVLDHVEIYNCTRNLLIRPNVTRDQAGLMVEHEGPDIHPQLSFRKSYPIGDPDIVKVRHDIVSSLLEDDTDVKISEITGRTEEFYNILSPDYYDFGTKLMGELGTSASNDIEYLKREFNSKYRKYEPYIEEIGCKGLAVFIVSSDKIASNYILEPAEVIVLCNRLKCGIALESKIITVEGKDIFREGMDQDTRKLKYIFRSIDENEGRSVDFDISAIKKTQEDLTREETLNVKNKLAADFRSTREVISPGPQALHDRYLEYRDRTTKLGVHPIDKMKRIINFPMICPTKGSNDYDYTLLKPGNFTENNLPGGLCKVWQACFSSGAIEPIENADEVRGVEEIIGRQAFEKHRIKKWHRFKPNLNEQDKIELACSGVMARSLKNNESVLSQEADSHLGFDPEALTTDIEKFHKSELLSHGSEGRNPKHETYISLISEAKELAGDNPTTSFSVRIMEKLFMDSDFFSLTDCMSCCFEEIAYSMKHWNQAEQFMYRYLRKYKVGMVIYNSATHVFVSYCFVEEPWSKIVETGRLGPLIYKMGNMYISDWCSYDQEHIEHYLKAGPYSLAIMSEVAHSLKLDLIEMLEDKSFHDYESNGEFWQITKFIFMMYMSKTDSEELMTSSRYLYMRLLDEFKPDPYIFVKRFPDVIRSRFTSYMLQGLKRIMLYYYERPVVRDFSTQGGVPFMKSIICDGEVSFEVIIDSFYYGYTVSKEKMTGVHSSMAICRKLMKEEFSHLKMIKEGGKPLEELDGPKPHQVDQLTLKYFVFVFKDIMSARIGVNYKEVIGRNISINIIKSTFAELGTLKASGGPSNEFEYEVGENDEFSDLSKKLKAHSRGPRPRAIESLVDLVNSYCEKHENASPENLFELIPYCLALLEDGFDSDLFPKSQHGGHREIHILQMSARVLQFFIELISRSILHHFPTDTISHPKEKESMVPTHYRDSNLAFTEYSTISKSADAKTWCQNHHTSAFAAVLLSATPEDFHPFIIRVMKLWTIKRVSLPESITPLFLANRNTVSSDPVFNEMRKRFISGELPFLKPLNSKVQISSGMFQGILHLTSSLYHTMIQEVHAEMVVRTCKDIYGFDVLVSHRQGSDDSAMMISFPTLQDKKKRRALCYKMLDWKERFASRLGIISSDKTATGITDIVEYNSEWYLRQQSIKPTFRWVSACLDFPVTETFIEEYRINSNVLTQVLEGGGSLLLASLIELSQAMLHYNLLGINSSPVFADAHNMLISTPSPVLGFYPLSKDLLAGVCGFDFNLWTLVKNNPKGAGVLSVADLYSWELDYEGQKPKEKSKALEDTRIKFTKKAKWESIVRRIKLPSREECEELIEADPLIIFGSHKTWEDDKITVALKLYSPGVKASLSKRMRLIRRQVASAYIMNCECFTVPGEDERRSLLYLWHHANSRERIEPNDENMKKLFPLHEEYKELFDSLQREAGENFAILPGILRRSNKATITVFEPAIYEDEPIMQLCKRKWFNTGVVKYNRTHFERAWLELKSRYVNIKDTLEETKEATGLTTLNLKYYLEGIDWKPRKIRLTDTNVKGSNLSSAITRIFWPDLRLIFFGDKHISDLIQIARHELFCFSNGWHAYREELVTDYIKGLEILSDDSLKRNRESFPLWFMKKALDGSDRMMLLEELETRKGGRLGYFSPRQKWKSGKRYGYGRWIGKIMGVTVCLEMMDNTLIKLTCSNLNSHDSLAYNLKDLIKELHLNFPTESSEPGIQYTISGRFCHSINRVTSAIPVFTDSYLTVDLSMIAKSTWSMICTDYSIRLVAKDGADEMTLCACYLGQSDYRPELIKVIESDNLDDALRARVRPSEKTWIKFVEEFSPPEASAREEQYEIARRTGLYHQAIDVKRLATIFRRSIEFFTKDVTVDTEALANMAAALTTEELDFISALNFGMAEDARDFEVEDYDMDVLGENVEEFDINDGQIDINDIDREDLDRMSRLYSVDERRDLAMKNIIGISPTNPIFDSLISYITQVHPDFTLAEMFSTEMTPRCLKYPWNIVVSMMTGKNYEQFSEDFDTQIYYENRLERISISLVSGTDRGSIDRMSILNDIIDNSVGIARQNALLLKKAEENYIERYSRGQFEFPNKWVDTLDVPRIYHELYYEMTGEKKRAYSRLSGPEKHTSQERLDRIELREEVVESDTIHKEEKLELLTKIANRKSKFIQLEILAWKYKCNIVLNYGEETVTILPILPGVEVSSECIYDKESSNLIVLPI